MSFSQIVTKGRVSDNKGSGDNCAQSAKTHLFEVDSPWIWEVARVLCQLDIQCCLGSPGNSSVGLLVLGCSLLSVSIEIDRFGLIIAMLSMNERVGMVVLLGEQLGQAALLCLVVFDSFFLEFLMLHALLVHELVYTKATY
jgi:hypothetical protein